MTEQNRSATPFDLRLDTPFGPMRVLVRPGRVAKIQCVAEGDAERRSLVPIQIEGAAFLVVADMMHDGERWRLRTFTGAAPSGGRDGDALGTRLTFASGLGPALDGAMRRFVERDLVEVFRERRVQDDSIGAVRAQIERRQAKIEVMEKARNASEEELSERELALRGEMDALSTDAIAVRDGSDPSPAVA